MSLVLVLEGQATEEVQQLEEFSMGVPATAYATPVVHEVGVLHTWFQILVDSELL